MCKTKFLALFLTVCMMLTSIGTFGIVANAEEVTEINVGQGVTYLLPDGETYADTSKVGYRIVNGTDGVTYRVNVGEYKEIMRDTFETYTEDQYEAKINQAINGGTFTKGAYAAADNTGAYLKKDGSNTILAIGPYKTNWTNAPSWKLTNFSPTDAFRVSAKIKVVDFDPSKSSNTTNYFVKLRLCDQDGVYFRAKTNTSDEITATEVRYESTSTDNEDVGKYVEWEKNGTVYSLKDDIEIAIEGNGKQYSAFLNDTELTDSQVWSETTTVPEKGIDNIDLAKTDAFTVTNATTYVEEVIYSKAVYVTDTLENVPVNATVEQGASSAQTATVALNMSDGTKKNFTVNYTADTATAGVKTADGKIDGFDGTVPVTYTVTGISKQTINTFVGADVELADGSKADTSSLGRRYKKVETDGAIIDYTINVGDWNIKRADDMSKHTNTTVDHDNNESTPALNIVDPAAFDGFQMNTFVNTNSTAAAVVTELDDGNDVLKFTGKNPDSNVSYILRDGFDGSFKYSMRMKIVADAATTSARQEAMRINLFNTTTSEYSYFYARVLTPKTGENTLSIQPYRTNQQAETKATNVTLKLNSDNKYETEWFDIVVIGKADTGTRDIYVNGELTHRDFMKYALKTDTDIDEAAKEAAKITDSTFESIKLGKTENNTLTVYVDDVSVSSYYNFEGALPEGKEVLIGQGKAAAGELPLTFSNGIVKKIPITVSGIDTAKLGTSAVKATLEGFDETVTVNAKVCNYHINALGFKENGEYISAPKAGGVVSDAIFTNVGSHTQATALFAWYDSQTNLESSKIVDLSSIAPGETKKVDVGLQLPADITGGMLKVFVVDSLKNITPIDVSALFTSFTATAPTVYMTGDSTTCNYKVTRFPEAGVGQMFGDYLNGASAVNMARSGLRAQTFIENGYWDTIMNNVKPGDYIFITFGHNELDDGTFEVNIPKFAKEADEKNANIIMYSPVARRLEALKGKAWNGFNYGGQMDFMKKYCEDNNIPYIDMTTLTQTHIQTLGEDKSAQLYMIDVYNNYANYENDARWAQSMFNTEEGRNKQKLSTDNSHFTFFGADTWAQMLAREIKNMNLVLSDYIVNTDTAITYPNLD